MILGLQITALTFSFIMIYFAILNYKRREINRFEITFWIVVWVFAIFAILFPDVLQNFAKQFRFARLFDMMVVGALIVVIAMVSRVYIVTNKITKKLEKFVRSDALKNVKKGKK